MAEIGNCIVGTIMGRYYGMDRVQSWDFTDRAYNCIVDAIGKKAVVRGIGTGTEIANSLLDLHSQFGAFQWFADRQYAA